MQWAMASSISMPSLSKLNLRLFLTTRVRPRRFPVSATHLWQTAPVRRRPAEVGLTGIRRDYEEHSRQIYYVALRFLGESDPSGRRDPRCVLKAYRKLGEFQASSAMRTWLYRITINHRRNLLQTWHQRNMVSNADDSLWETAVAARRVPARTGNQGTWPTRIHKLLMVCRRNTAFVASCPDQQMSTGDCHVDGAKPRRRPRQITPRRKAFIASFQI